MQNYKLLPISVYDKSLNTVESVFSNYYDHKTCVKHDVLTDYQVKLYTVKPIIITRIQNKINKLK